MMRKLTADYIFPLNRSPVKNGILIIDDYGSIIDLLPNERKECMTEDIEVFNGFLCPGFVNSHCHLELSHLKNLIPPHVGLDNFIASLEQLKSTSNYDDIISGMESAEEEMIKNGIVAVGDISNSSDSFRIKETSKLVYHSFIEIYGSNPEQAENIFDSALALLKKILANTSNNKASIVPHSTYSVSQALFKKIREFAEENNSIISIHHQENEDENLFFFNKTGKIVERMSRFGVDISEFKANGQRPIESVAGFLPEASNIQLVHNTVSVDKDISFAKNNFSKMYFCLCPNANIYIENKLPDIKLFFESGAKITIGTDGAVSNKDLSILNELKTISQNYQDIPLHELLRWACLNGADFLDIYDTFGSFEKSKIPGINLIENVDIQNISLTKESKIRVIV